MDNFVRQYFITALWSSTDGNEDHLDENYDLEDLADGTIAAGIEDCNKFRKDNAELIKDDDETDIAHDFWLTRNGHGVGFWDRNHSQEKSDALCKSCDEFGECWLFVGDDGKVYFM